MTLARNLADLGNQVDSSGTLGIGGGGTSATTANASFNALAPSQTSNSGKYLKTDGSNTSWSTVDALPSQTGNTGKFLTTDGTSASWSSSLVTGLTAGTGISVSSSTGSVTVTNSLPMAYPSSGLPISTGSAWGTSITGSATGQVLTWNGTTWVAQAPSGGSSFLVKTSNYTASAGESILADTSSGSFTVTLPASPTAGQTVYIQDAKGTFSTYKLIIGRNGNTIMNTAEDMDISVSNQGCGLVYNGSDWRIY